MQRESIIDFALRHLAEDRRPTVQIAAESGVKQRWLQNLRNGEIPKPGAHLIDRIASYYGFYVRRDATHCSEARPSQTVAGATAHD